MDFEEKAEQAKELTIKATQMFMENNYSTGVSCVVMTRMAAGFCRAAGIDIHKATDMFLTFYKDADKVLGKDSE